jgi:hypothetical protein
LIELTHPENGIGNRNARQGGIIHAEGVFVGGLVGVGVIIHAAGVRFGFPSSSAPRRARHNFLGNKSMVDALLSRVRHYCHTVNIDGPSLRELQG